MVSEKDKMLNGELYDANYNHELIEERNSCKILCQRYNTFGAGSVVNRDIPSNTVAVGNPCRVIKNI